MSPTLRGPAGWQMAFTAHRDSVVAVLDGASPLVEVVDVECLADRLVVRVGRLDGTGSAWPVVAAMATFWPGTIFAGAEVALEVVDGRQAVVTGHGSMVEVARVGRPGWVWERRIGAVVR